MHAGKGAWAAKIVEVRHRTPVMADACHRGAEPTGGVIVDYGHTGGRASD